MLFIFCTSALLASVDQTAILQSANQAYEEGDFSKAIKSYEELLQADYQSADLHYNLANAYYRSNEMGPAVLHYEKAALRDPRDKDIQHNLRVIKDKLPDQFETIPDFFIQRWWNNTQQLCSPTAWGIIGLLLLWTGIAGLVFWLRGDNRALRKRGFLIGLILILFSILPFSLGFSAKSRINNSQRAVVMVVQTNLKSAPDEVSEDIIELHAGTSLTILDEIGDWKKIRLSNGEEGWLETSVLGMI